MSGSGHALPKTRVDVRSASESDSGGVPLRTELVVGGLAPRLIRKDERSAHIGLVAAEMLLLAGDRVDIHVSVGAGCLLRIQDIGGTVAYPRRDSRAPEHPEEMAQWNIHVDLGPGAVLLWEGLPFIASETAQVLRSTRVNLGQGAVAVIRETLVLGRHREQGGRVRSRLEVHEAAGPVLVEEVVADGTDQEPGVLGAHRILDQVLAVGFRPQEAEGDLALYAPGAISRHLGAETHASPLKDVFSRWSERAEVAQASTLPATATPADHSAGATLRGSNTR